MYKKFDILINNDFYIESKNILELKGMGELSSTPQTMSNADGSGEIIIGTNIDPRTITLKFKVAREEADSKVRYFAAGKKLTVVHKQRKIECVCAYRKLEYENNIFNDPYITVNLFAGDPYFYNVDDFGQNMAGVQPLFGFPWTPTKESGISFSYFIFTDRTIFTNNGDKPVGLTIEFEATSDVINPIFENLITGEYLKIITTLKQGDKLEISTVKGNKYVRKNGVDIFDAADILSTFFYLEVGDNLLGFSADDGSANLNAYLRYLAAYASNEVY